MMSCGYHIFSNMMRLKEQLTSPLFPQTHNPGLIIRKISDTPKLRDILQDTWSVPLQNCQDHEKQWKIRGKCGDKTTKQCAILGWLPELKKDINGKKLVNYKQSLELIVMCQCWFLNLNKCKYKMLMKEVGEGYTRTLQVIFETLL